MTLSSQKIGKREFLASLEMTARAEAALKILFGVGIDFGNIFPRRVTQFATDDVCGEAGAEEAAIERGELLVVDFAAEGAEFSRDALADERSFVGLLGGFFDGSFDVAVRDAAGPEVARDAELALLARFGAMTGKLLGVAGVVNVAGAFEASQDVFDQGSVFATALERFLHLMDGVSTAHEDFDGSVVKSGFGIELAGLGEHKESIEEEVASG